MKKHELLLRKLSLIKVWKHIAYSSCFFFTHALSGKHVTFGH